MSCEFLAGKSPEFTARATKLARILDDTFDGFGGLVAEAAIDHAAVILEAIEDKGCRIVFADDGDAGAEALP